MTRIPAVWLKPREPCLKSMQSETVPFSFAPVRGLDVRGVAVHVSTVGSSIHFGMGIPVRTAVPRRNYDRYIAVIGASGFQFAPDGHDPYGGCPLPG